MSSIHSIMICVLVFVSHVWTFPWCVQNDYLRYGICDILNNIYHEDQMNCHARHAVSQHGHKNVRKYRSNKSLLYQLYYFPLAGADMCCASGAVGSMWPLWYNEDGVIMAVQQKWNRWWQKCKLSSNTLNCWCFVVVNNKGYCTSNRFVGIYHINEILTICVSEVCAT